MRAGEAAFGEEDCQKGGQAGRSSSGRTSEVESSERVVSELLLDSEEASERLWLPASEGETGTEGGAVSPADAGCCLPLCWMLPRERMRPSEARREWERRDLTEGALERRVEESTLSVVGADEGGGGGRRAAGEARRRGRTAATSGGAAAVACRGLVAQRGSWPGEGGAAAAVVVVVVWAAGAVECL